MLRTYVVRLFAHDRAEFPAECVACGAEQPDSAIRVSDRASGLMSFFVPLLYFFGRKHVVAAPACASCRRADTWQKFFRFAALIALVFGVLRYVSPWIASFELGRAPTRWLVALVLLACLIPLYFLSKLYPRAFVVEVEKDVTEYHFARPDYAEAFAAQNGAELDW